MAKKTSKISINKWESTKANNVEIIPYEGVEETEIIIQKVLPLPKVLEFVEEVVASCVDTETGMYMPEIFDFAMKSAVLTKYANFTLPSNVEKQYELIYNTDAVRQVMVYVNHEQYDEIYQAILCKISHKCSLIESANAAMVNSFIAKLGGIAEQLESAFSGVSGEDLGGLIKAVSGMNNVSEEKLVKAVFEAQKENSTEEKVIPFPAGE